MKIDLPTEEAKKQHIQNSDVFRGSHIFYLDDFHRDNGVVSLNSESYLAFIDTLLVKNRVQIYRERAAMIAWMQSKDWPNSQPPSALAGLATLKYMNLEFLKMGCGFELHIRARLLSKGYVLHDIDGKDSRYRLLAKVQKQEPVPVSRMLAIEPFRFNGRENYLPGLRDTSIQFSLLTTSSKYRKETGLPDETVDIIEQYRKMRNLIHFPGDCISVGKQMRTKDQCVLDFIVEFVNTEIVEWTNRIVADRHLPSSLTIDSI